MKFVLLTGMLAASSVFAASHEVKMLNNGKDGIMVFEPSYLKASKGDTIKFLPTDPSHEVSSVSIPKGAKEFKGAMSKAVTITVKEEGVYLYECASHLPMAMIGVVQVGKPVNLADAKKVGAEQLAPKFALNKDRLDKIFAQVK